MIFCDNFMLPKRRFWIAERTFGNDFQSSFQRVSTRFGLRYFEITSKMRSQMFVRTSKFSFGEHKLCKMITKDSSNMWLCCFLGLGTKDSSIVPCDVLVLWDWVFWWYELCNNFMLPKRRFWKSDERLGTHFRSTFQRGEYSILATLLWNYFENAFQNVRSDFQNLRLGSINFERWLQKIVAKCDVLVFLGLGTKDSSNMGCVGFMGLGFWWYELCNNFATFKLRDD